MSHRSDTDSRGTHLHRSTLVQSQQIQPYMCNCTTQALCVSSLLANHNHVECRAPKRQAVHLGPVKDRCKDLWKGRTAPPASRTHRYKRMTTCQCLYTKRHSSTGSRYSHQNHLHRVSLPNQVHTRTHVHQWRRCCKEHLGRLCTVKVARMYANTLWVPRQHRHRTVHRHHWTPSMWRRFGTGYCCTHQCRHHSARPSILVHKCSCKSRSSREAHPVCSPGYKIRRGTAPCRR